MEVGSGLAAVGVGPVGMGPVGVGPVGVGPVAVGEWPGSVVYAAVQVQVQVPLAVGGQGPGWALGLGQPAAAVGEWARLAVGGWALARPPPALPHHLPHIP